MPKHSADNAVESRASGSPERVGEDDRNPSKAPEEPSRPREIGGRDGPDPVRYGDWEKDGRCIDF